MLPKKTPYSIALALKRVINSVIFFASLILGFRLGYWGAGFSMHARVPMFDYTESQLIHFAFYTAIFVSLSVVIIAYTAYKRKMPIFDLNDLSIRFFILRFLFFLSSSFLGGVLAFIVLTGSIISYILFMFHKS